MKTVKKEERYDKIHEIITRQVIETQEDLTNALRRQGIEVTQATVSRDIKELMLRAQMLAPMQVSTSAPISP